MYKGMSEVCVWSMFYSQMACTVYEQRKLEACSWSFTCCAVQSRNPWGGNMVCIISHLSWLFICVPALPDLRCLYEAVEGLIPPSNFCHRNSGCDTWAVVCVCVCMSHTWSAQVIVVHVHNKVQKLLHHLFRGLQNFTVFIGCFISILPWILWTLSLASNISMHSTNVTVFFLVM